MKLIDITLKEKNQSVHNRIGFTTNEMWSDRTMREAFFWIVNNPASPYHNHPTLITRAMGLTKGMAGRDFIRKLKADEPIRLSFRMRLKNTRSLKAILAGALEIGRAHV